MRVRIVLRSLWVVAVSALFAGCGGAAVSQEPASAVAARALLPPKPIHLDRRRSWLSPAAATAKQLLFESDPGTFEVYLFALPSMTAVGTLTGFKEPLGECADANGNVWIANYLRHELLEYSHTGQPLSKIVHHGLNPWSCAIDPANGTIAITDLAQSNNNPGKVLLYANPSATPLVLSNPEQYLYYYAAFDASGNLWVDGIDALGHFLLSKCNASSCSTITLTGGSLFSPGAVAWDSVKKTLVVFDSYCHDLPNTCSYPISADGAVGTPTAYLNPSGGAPCDVVQAALVESGKQTVVVGADNEVACGAYQRSTVDRWTYPAGGTPATSTVGTVYPWGAAVSSK